MMVSPVIVPFNRFLAAMTGLTAKVPSVSKVTHHRNVTKDSHCTQPVYNMRSYARRSKV